MSALVLYSPPAMAPELRFEVERLIAGPVRFPGLGGDDPGIVVAPVPRYHPDAQAEADAKRAVLARPIVPEVIRLWAQTLAAGHGNAPRTPEALGMWLSAVIFACGDDVPGGAWDAVALRQAMREFKRYWPNAGEVADLLLQHTARLRCEIEALERIARGDLGRSYVRGSRDYLDRVTASGSAAVPPERPEHPSSARPGIAHDFDDMTGRSTIPAVAPVRTIEQQLAALGFTPEAAAQALAKMNARSSQPAPVEAIPAAPSPESPALPAERLTKALAAPRRRGRAATTQRDRRA